MWENTPLISACQYKHEAVCRALVAAGADCNARNERGCTPLLHAALEGLVGLVELLLTHGAQAAPPIGLVYNYSTGAPPRAWPARPSRPAPSDTLLRPPSQMPTSCCRRSSQPA